MKRIRFTERELDLIINMFCIASAAQLGEGDYIGRDWEADDANEVMENAWSKIGELRDRLKRKER